jgi:uncharacterized membrane protein
MGWRRRLQLAALVAFVVAYASLSHYANSAATTHDLALALALVPVLGLGLVLIGRWTRPRWSGLPLAVLTASLAALLLRHHWSALERNFAVVYLLQEGSFYALMAASFGRSLWSDAALCTRLADKLHGPLSAAEVLYTRRVTAAWALFFAAITVATLLLFAYAPLPVWSLFANFCVVPLIALMFVAEYAVRRRVLPQVRRQGVLAAVQVYFAGTSKESV